MSDPVHVDLLRHRAAVGSAVRVPEGDARRAGAAAAHHDRPHARRRDDRDDSGRARADRLPDRRVPAATAPGRCRWRCCSWRSSAIVFAALGTAIGSSAAGHAGLSADHELPGHADLLPVGRALPADEPARRADGGDAHRSADLRRRRPARRLHRRASIGIGLDAMVLSAVAALFLVLGARAFSKIQV